MDWPRALHPYYAFHGAAIISYLVLHHTVLRSAAPSARSRLEKWEMQAALSLGIVLAIRCVRRITWEVFLSDALLYSKALVALLAFMLDWRLLAWYLVIFAMLFLLCVQPAPSDEGNVLPLTPLQLENLLTDGNQNIVRLVEFGAVWSPRCVQLRRLFSEISVRYSKSGVQFSRIDLGRFPSVAAKYGIEFGVALRQLPTLIMFEGENEVCRLPERSYDGTFSAQSLSEKNIIQKFGLDAHMLQRMSRQIQLRQSFQTVKQSN
ncbi:hypothetical protein SELMODRAFT_422846 [Selaginella moellendorffii]|uniref:Thioredoxin domain-containing protein n=1 Tax=Selaginella moellendorffii TaxID=88036 RepID=D8SJQ9_SELML|nr:thioredoxin-related transmembrane protein 2 [Selaginella moellendorffii]XP_024544365.1 thioredoxin-related transmembrane protein 2 [Selaginella moellendorffii]EFJ15405.1 hypothetical protein SELMODRAFT_422846 [Selaginella moellendorffii]|eukprot:XP_002983504.1 thioredoxin-related transmembrane protein 2 [Selaginella moellendorffii]